MKESEIRDRAVHTRYLELVREDAEELLERADRFETVPCPVCGEAIGEPAIEKGGFVYELCAGCDTLYMSPRPQLEDLALIYRDSPSTRYWIEEFFTPKVEARREKIFRPRAAYVAASFPGSSEGRVGDIGAGFGLFAEELARLWPRAGIVAIEPSEDMAGICRSKGIEVVEAMLEDLEPGDPPYDILTAFELFEHLRDPLGFLRTARNLLRPGGILLFTTLNGLGFDIQVLWEHSKSVSPPHHLNFANPFTIHRLIERAGLETVSVDTPGVLDWEIVEGAWTEDDVDPGRLFRSLSARGSNESKSALQSWITEHRFSSHMRVVARRPVER